MSDAVTVALIAGIPLALLQLGNIYKTHIADKSAKASAVLIKQDVTAVKSEMDGHFIDMIKIIAKQSKDSGFLEGVASEKHAGEDTH
jgi:hypothetical protein